MKRIFRGPPAGGYGPHDPATAPAEVTVSLPGTYAGEAERPIGPAVVRQRKRINDEAHTRGEQVADSG